ncbi:MAG: putative sigma-54 modulation protein [Patiriisocius sp.]|jgi:putative sigma-54 modulation protein
MQIDVHSVHFDADIKLIDFIKIRLEKLKQYHKNITNSEVFLKLENESSLTNKVVEIKINIPGNDLFSKKQCKSFEEATDEAVDALRRQILKRKEKFK